MDRPRVLNTINKELIAEPVGAAEAFDADDGIDCIVDPGSERSLV